MIHKTHTPRIRLGVVAVVLRMLMVCAPVIGVLTFLLLWQLAWKLNASAMPSPAPWDVLRHVAGDPQFYWSNGWQTAKEATLGFLLAMVVGVSGGALLVNLPFMERAIQPIMVLIQVTPIIAYAPAVVIWLDFGTKPVVFLSAVVCVVPFLQNAITGLRAVDPGALELARSVDASAAEVIWRLRLPSALPYLFVAARISVGLALVGATFGEFFAVVPKGLGHIVYRALLYNWKLQLFCW